MRLGCQDFVSASPNCPHSPTFTWHLRDRIGRKGPAEKKKIAFPSIFQRRHRRSSVKGWLCLLPPPGEPPYPPLTRSCSNLANLSFSEWMRAFIEGKIVVENWIAWGEKKRRETAEGKKKTSARVLRFCQRQVSRRETGCLHVKLQANCFPGLFFSLTSNPRRIFATSKTLSSTHRTL